MVDSDRGRYYYVTICGPLASGKTSLAQILANDLLWWPIYEDLDQHPYVNDFYEDMKKQGFHLAVYFLIHALELQPQIKKLIIDRSICQDWHVAEHHEVYNYHMLEEGIIDKKDFATCEKLHRILMTHALPPDFIIYLKAETETIVSRILRRNREGENKIFSAPYIDNLVKRYQSWIQTFTIPVLQIDMERYDFMYNERDKISVLEQIRDFLSKLELTRRKIQL